MSEEQGNKKAGPFAIFVKLGPKLLSALVKLLKVLKVGKLGLAAASFATYAYLLSWQFACAIMVMLLIHEGGHIWAMHRLGMKTKGIYFIPFFGGAAVASDQFPSRGGEVFVAIAGPIAGGLLALVAAGVHYATGSPMWAALAGWMAMVNLFNLIPLNPLDGGRIMKSIAFSIHSWFGFVILVLGLVASILFSIKLGLGLLVFLGVVGAVDLFFEWTKYHTTGKQMLQPMTPMGTFYALTAHVVVAGALLMLMFSMTHEPGAAAALEVLKH